MGEKKTSGKLLTQNLDCIARTSDNRNVCTQSNKMAKIHLRHVFCLCSTEGVPYKGQHRPIENQFWPRRSIERARNGWTLQWSHIKCCFAAQTLSMNSTVFFFRWYSFIGRFAVAIRKLSSISPLAPNIQTYLVHNLLLSLFLYRQFALYHSPSIRNWIHLLNCSIRKSTQIT